MDRGWRETAIQDGQSALGARRHPCLPRPRLTTPGLRLENEGINTKPEGEEWRTIGDWDGFLVRVGSEGRGVCERSGI